MTLSRRDSIRTFGIALASLMLARCKSLKSLSNAPSPIGYNPVPLSTPTVTCYMPTDEPTLTPTPGMTHISGALGPRDRLHQCWLSFNELAERTSSGQNQGDDGLGDILGQSLSTEHRKALDELVAAGELETPVADLVQEAYDAAIYHVWRSNAPITCYEPAIVDFAPASAGQLVQQSAVLAQMAEEAQLDPNTVAVAQASIERDLAFEALTAEEVQQLYETLMEEFSQGNEVIPSFDEVALDITPEAQKAAEFLVELLTER